MGEKTITAPLHTKDVNAKGDKTYCPPTQERDEENDYMQSWPQIVMAQEFLVIKVQEIMAVKKQE